MSYKSCPAQYHSCMNALDCQAKEVWKKKGHPNQFNIRCNRCGTKIKVEVDMCPVFNYEV